jgi:predicted acyl esterase
MLAAVASQASGDTRRSAPGDYAGYSEALYDGYQLTSRYVSVRDGTRIAVDVIRPTLHGAVVATPMPVIWMNTPYNRRLTDGGQTAQLYPGAALALVRYGYVVAAADMRGDYASFGMAMHTNRNEWMPWAYWDAYDVTEWLAAQPWSTGAIGMWGCSASGHSQWQAAATHPPHLRAIFPMSAPSEYYDWGGLSAAEPEPAREAPDAEAVPVDDDPGGRLLAAARRDHQANREPGFMPYRDSVSTGLAELGYANFRYWLEANTFSHLREVNRAAIPAYQSSNYGEDIRVRQGVLIKQRSLRAPTRLIIGPGAHCHWTSPFRVAADNPFDITIEERRWFDHWLKGIDNGVTREPPIRYFTYNADADRVWLSAWQWPLPNARRIDFIFGPAHGLEPGVEPTAGSDQYRIDYAAIGAERDRRGLTYTSAPLDADTTITGSPVIDLWIASTATDGDFLARLEDVAPDGNVAPLPGTEDGRLRASHRALAPAPYDNFGLPYHRSYRVDTHPLVPGRPAELRFDLAPISWQFPAGHRIRLVITGVAEARRGAAPPTPRIDPPPVVTVLRDSAHRSRIELPVVGRLQPAIRTSRHGRNVIVTLDFAGLDRHYLGDLDEAGLSGSLGRPASVRKDAQRLVLTFPASRIRPGAPVTVTGRFGRQFQYGPAMAFEARTQIR